MKNKQLLLMLSFLCGMFHTVFTLVDKQREIVFGQSGSFNGTMGLYGKTIRDGINAYFSRINDEGGIHGKKLRLISYEDDGRLDKAKKNIKRLRNQGIDLFIGNMGTDNVLALLPELKREEVGLFFPWSGDERLRDTSLLSLVNGAGYLTPQLTYLSDYVVNSLGHKRVAVFHGDDSFSVQAAEFFKKQLQSLGIQTLASVSYNRFTLDITDSALTLKTADPRVIICIGTSIPVVKLINYFFEQGYYATTFLGIDSTLFVGEKLRGKGANFKYTSSVPHPMHSQLAIAKNYLRDIERFCPDETPNILSFSYYLSAAILVEALRMLDGDISGGALARQVARMKDYKIEDFRCSFDEKTRHIYGLDAYLVES